MGSNSGSSTAGASAFRPGIPGVWVGGRGDIRRGHRNVAGFRRGLAEEVLRRGLHRIRHHRLDDGAGCRVAERVHAKRAARAQNDGLDGLTAALFYLGMVRAQVDVKRARGAPGR